MALLSTYYQFYLLIYFSEKKQQAVNFHIHLQEKIQVPTKILTLLLEYIQLDLTADSNSSIQSAFPV